MVSKLLFYIILPCIAFLATIFFYTEYKKSQLIGVSHFSQTPLPTPTPFNPFPYKIPIVTSDHAYRTLLIGDSMTEALGENANKLRLALIKNYPNKEFVNYNYGFGATNITSLPERIVNQNTHNGTVYPPIISQKVELIIIESFAYNPLSDLPLAAGIAKHNEILDKTIASLVQSSPGTVIALMTPIAPSYKNFAKGTYDLSEEQRKVWVDERVSYIQNHIDYATKNNIPLINVYEKSRLPSGEVDLKYISSDNIHPSKIGIELIANTIADFVYQNKIFPEN